MRRRRSTRVLIAVLLASTALFASSAAHAVAPSGRVSVWSPSGYISASGDGFVCAYGADPGAQFMTCGPGAVTILGLEQATIKANIGDGSGRYAIDVRVKGTGQIALNRTLQVGPPQAWCMAWPQYKVPIRGGVEAERAGIPQGSFVYASEQTGATDLGPVTSARLYQGGTVSQDPIIGFCLL